ncbi:MAG: GAF domain-containing protein [Chryseolinea sp.]
MTGLLSDRYRILLLLASLFILGIGVSFYLIYSLPHTLQLAQGYGDAFNLLYIVLGITFLLGAGTLLDALRYKKEILVYRDRALEAAHAQHESDQSGKTTISLEHLISVLNAQKDEKNIMDKGINAIAKELEAGQGAIYKVREEEGKRAVVLEAGYALSIGESTEIKFEYGEGLIGQSAASGNTLYLDDIPEGYIKIVSGLGSAYPKFLLIVPVKSGEQVRGVVELATFKPITEDQRKFVEEASQLIAEKI